MLDCQLEREYTKEEWRAFVDCAREGFLTGKGLDNEFYPKIGVHGVSDREVGLAIRLRSRLFRYEKDGSDKLAVWDPDSRLLVIARLPSGLIFNAFEVLDINEYMGRQPKARWLKR
jgi:hypothetical protein